MMKKLFWIIVCISFPVIANGAEWKLIDRDEQAQYSTYYFMDKESVKKLPNNLVRYWYVTRSLLEGTETMEDMTKYGYKDYIEMDCKNRKVRSVETELEPSAGYIEEIREWHNIAPDSVTDKIHKMLCNDK